MHALAQLLFGFEIISDPQDSAKAQAYGWM